MQRTFAQCRKELAQFRRDRLTVALALILPLATLLIFGYAIRLESKHIPLAIQDWDQSWLSRAYIERLFATNQFVPVRRSESDDAIAPIDRGHAKATVVIPPDFSRRVAKHLPSPVQVLIDGSDVNNARVIRNSIQATTYYFMQINHLLPGSERVVAQVRLWFNPGRRESLFIVPGVYAVVLAVFPALLAAIAMVREKEQATILQVYASDLKPIEWVLGKGLAYFLVGQLESGLVLTGAVVFFGLRLVGDPTPFLVGNTVFISASVLFGLWIGSRASNQGAAVQAVALVSFLTALLLSGFIYPISNIPFPLSLISWVVPARYFMEITRDAFVRGTGWAGVWPAELALIGLALLFLRAVLLATQRMQLKD